jgi:hypothetical protein
MLFYRAALPLSCKTLNYTAGIIRRHRKSIGSLWRKLNPGQQALVVLALCRAKTRSPSLTWCFTFAKQLFGIH